MEAEAEAEVRSKSVDGGYDVDAMAGSGVVVAVGVNDASRRSGRNGDRRGIVWVDPGQQDCGIVMSRRRRRRRRRTKTFSLALSIFPDLLFYVT